MADFRDEDHPRDEAGKFIESGGDKLKAWGKAGARKPSGFAGVKRPTTIGDSGFWPPGTVGRYNDPWSADKITRQHRERVHDVRTFEKSVRSAQFQLDRAKKQVQELETLRKKQGKLTVGQEADLKQLREYFIPTDKANLLGRQRVLNEMKLGRGEDPFLRSKIPSPKGGKAELGVTRPPAGRSKVDIFARLGGNESQIAEFQKSPELKQAFENIKHQSDLKKQADEKLKQIRAADKEAGGETE